MTQNLVSIIVPIYNGEKYLAKCIKSILSQSYKNIEILLINDGSIDGSKVICKEYAIKDSRIKIIHQENKGPSSARNLGINKSSGDYIQFVDSDDYISPNMVEKLLSQYNPQVSLVLCGYNKKTTKTNEIIPNHEGIFNMSEFMEFFPELFKKTLINSPCNKLYDAEIIKKNKLKFLLNVNNGEDLIFNLEYIKHCNKISLVKLPLYNYNLIANSSSLTKDFKKNYFINRKVVFKHLYNFVKDYTYTNPLSISLLEKTYTSYIRGSIINLLHPKSKLGYKEKKKYISDIIKDDCVQDNIEKIGKGRLSGITLRFLMRKQLSSLILIYFKTKLFIRKIAKKILLR